MLDLEFMRLAFAVGIVVGVLAPAVGFFLVERKQSLVGDGLGHVAFEHLGFVRAVDSASYTPVDLPVTAGIVVVLTTVIIVTNLIADVLYSWVDPRVELDGSPVPV